MPVYQYEGQHYDLPDGLTTEQAIAKIRGHLGASASACDSMASLISNSFSIYVPVTGR